MTMWGYELPEPVDWVPLLVMSVVVGAFEAVFFRVDFLKIDRSFVGGLSTGATDQAIVLAVIDLAHTLGMTVVAEGVETRAQLDELRALGCDRAQGHLVPCPVLDPAR